MPIYTKDQMIEAVDAFPSELRGVLFSPVTEDDVQEIGMKEGLLVDQLKNLNTLVNYVILGLLSKKDFVAECQQTLSVTEDVANKLTEAISREIFAPNEELRTKAILEQRKKEEREKVLFSESSEETSNEVVANVPLETNAQGSPLTPNTSNLKPSFAPDNLPTDLIEVEPIPPSVVSGQLSVVPPVPPVSPSMVSDQWSDVPPIPPAHPFEEKMKRVFTAGQQNMNELIIKTPEPQSVVGGQLSSVPPVSTSIVSDQMSVVPPVPSAPQSVVSDQSSVVPPVPPIPASPSIASGHMSVVPPVPHTDPYREPIE